MSLKICPIMPAFLRRETPSPSSRKLTTFPTCPSALHDTQVLVQATADKRAKLALAVEALRTTEGRSLIFTQKKATADWVRNEALGRAGRTVNSFLFTDGLWMLE